jgi:hypothetical protein
MKIPDSRNLSHFIARTKFENFAMFFALGSMSLFQATVCFSNALHNESWPLFILGIALALSALICLSASIVRFICAWDKRWLERARRRPESSIKSPANP